MMNRTLQYFKNIKFNPLVNRTIANQGKKNMAVNIIKNRTKNYPQYLSIRKYSTKTRPLSFNTGPFNDSKPPNNNHWIIAASIICGTAFTVQKN